MQNSVEPVLIPKEQARQDPRKDGKFMEFFFRKKFITRTYSSSCQPLLK